MKLVEAFIALTLGLFLSVTVWRVAAVQTRFDSALTDEGLDAAALRTLGGVLDWELASGQFRVEGQTIVLRAFRGWGTVCSSAADSATVLWQGIRLPDPERDSVLLFDASGGTRVRALWRVRRTSGVAECSAPGVEVLHLAWQPASMDGAAAGAELRLLRAFESGAYLPADALRYRRTGTRAQPLTTERFERVELGRSAQPGAQLWLAAETATGRAGWRW